MSPKKIMRYNSLVLYHHLVVRGSTANRHEFFFKLNNIQSGAAFPISFKQVGKFLGVFFLTFRLIYCCLLEVSSLECKLLLIIVTFCSSLAFILTFSSLSVRTWSCWSPSFAPRCPGPMVRTPGRVVAAAAESTRPARGHRAAWAVRSAAGSCGRTWAQPRKIPADSTPCSSAWTSPRKSCWRRESKWKVKRERKRKTYSVSRSQGIEVIS